MTPPAIELTLIYAHPGPRADAPKRHVRAGVERLWVAVGEGNGARASEALANAVAMAQGDLLAFPDLDAPWSSRHAQERVALHRQRPELVFSFVGRIDPDKPPPLWDWSPTLRQGWIKLPDAVSLLRRSRGVDDASVAVRRNALLKVGGFVDSSATILTWDLWLRLARLGPVAALTPPPPGWRPGSPPGSRPGWRRAA